ncbi:uncharacterized protein LOC110442271 [Mizuhopecten yessoensis]|uniref:uncharacterized protein LOC110442271 n=1 Tax=Mizuhopecten yessoensis TaxID=6573 RepID=UPI000B4580A3|nr:uncharacterized protein LOC110442271 [Mizuhopecten yessoensis]
MSSNHHTKQSPSHLDECPTCRRRAARMEQSVVKQVPKRRPTTKKPNPVKLKKTTFTSKPVGEFPSLKSGFIISHIHALSKDHAYVWHYSEKNILVVNTTGGVEQTLKLDTNSAVIDIGVSPRSGNIWYACGDGAVVEMMKNKTCLTRFNLGFEPRCLCLSSKNQVLVGLECNMLVLSIGGHIVTDLQKINPDVDLVEFCPSKIAQCPYTDFFCACDFFHHYFVLLDPSLKIIWWFRGSTVTDARGVVKDTGYSSPDLFWPHTAAFEKDGTIIVGNKDDNNALIAIGRDGHVLQVISREEDEPYALCLHKDGNLWVGLDTRLVKVYQLSGKQVTLRQPLTL